MVCEFMLIPRRDGAEIDSPLELLPLPNGTWDGKIAYLDRDGVLNVGSENYINSPEELVVFPNTANSVAALRESGFRVCVVTNQSPVGRGLWSDENLHSIHKKLRELLLSENSNAHLDLILYSIVLMLLGKVLGLVSRIQECLKRLDKLFRHQKKILKLNLDLIMTGMIIMMNLNQLWLGTEM